MIRMFYKLTKKFILENMDALLCQYHTTFYDDVRENNKSNYIPETFSVAQKRRGEKMIFFEDLTFEQWIKNMIEEQVVSAGISVGLNTAIQQVYENFLLLVDMCGSEHEIYNQETVDILRRITVYTLFGELTDNIDTAQSFNHLAHSVMPAAINKVRRLGLDIEDILKISVVSGLSGLDLKGATAAASSHSNDGIPMRNFIGMEPIVAADAYVNNLLEAYKQRTFPIFHFDEFRKLIESKNNAKIVWFTDDIIESYFDLFFIECLLKKYNVEIALIPKNGRYGNDASYYDIKRMLGQSFGYLTTEKRFSVISEGPLMAAANIKKFSEIMNKICSSSDFWVLKGCRISEMLNGLAHKPTFSAFNIIRTVSERLAGISSVDNASVFYYLSPKEYAFWGVHGHNDIVKKKEIISSIALHYKKHEKLCQVLDRFNYLKLLEKSYSGNKRPLYQEMESLVDWLAVHIGDSYNKVGEAYDSLERRNYRVAESKKWETLLEYIVNELGSNCKNIKLLDVGVGDGKGVMYALEKGFDVYGCDISEKFINITQAKIPQETRKKIIKSDMRALNYPDSSFQVIRHNATLVHMPVIAKGYGADRAISEANRVLCENGILYISLKLGSDENLCTIDTGEGLGERVYQLYKKETIHSLLQENGFVVLDACELTEKRSSQCEIYWYNLVAQKVSSSK